MEQSEREAIDAIESYKRPPDEPYGGSGEVDPEQFDRTYSEPIEFLKDAVAALTEDRDPEGAIAAAREAVARIEAII